MTEHRVPPSDHAGGRSTTRRAADRVVDLVRRRVGAIAAVVAVIALVAVPFASHRTDADEPDFDPDGEIYEVMDLVDARFNRSEVAAVQIIVEAREGNVLDRDVLLEWLSNTDRLAADDGFGRHLARGRVSGVTGVVDGGWSIAQAVDDRLAAGVAGSSESQVADAVDEVLADPGVQRTLAQSATRAGGHWRAPAFMATLLVDNDTFPDDVAERRESGGSPAYLGLEAQQWARDALAVLQGDQTTYRALGAGFDGGLAFSEQLGAAAPFILLAIVCIVLLVGILLRSYWAAAIVVLSLGCTLLVYGAVLDVLGFEGGMLLGFIVPIAGIAFGVDFFIHAAERIRDEPAGAGAPSDSDGLAAVAPALIVALASSVVAFLANTVSGVQAIVQFGVGAAVLLTLSFVLLGFVAPSALARLEALVPTRRRSVGGRIAWGAALAVLAIVGGVTVTMAIVAPVVAAVALAAVGALLVAVPFAVALRRARSRPTPPVAPVTAGGSALVGRCVATVASARAVALPVVAILGIVGLVGFARVDSAFAFSDFYDADSEFIQGLELLDEHFGSTAGAGEGFLYLEGDLADPAVLAEIERIPLAIAELEDRGGVAFLSRDLDGAPIVAPNAVTLVRAVTTSAPARAAVVTESGVEITDDDSDGLADTSAQVRAIIDHASANGVLGPNGRSLYTADAVRSVVAPVAEGWATTVRIGINSLTDDRIVDPARAALDEVAEDVRAAHAEHLDRVAVSGATIVQRDSQNSFTDAMRLALPVSFVACVLLVAIVLRSVRDAVVTVGPSLLVVIWIYGVMAALGLSVNVVTATIAAIAVGVGLDYSTHFTMRFREELPSSSSPTEAIRRAGTDTGGALAISALSSVLGFGVMALAPMPVFAMFGMLTAVMVLLSLAVSLFVLPGLLLLTGAGASPAGSGTPVTLPPPVGRPAEVDGGDEVDEVDSVARVAVDA